MKTQDLTVRENQVAELLAWGAAKKEVADQLGICYTTVDTLTRRIFSKLNIQKTTELCVWYFCSHFNISMDLSPVKRQVVAAALLVLVLYTMLYDNSSNYVRTRTTTRTAQNRTPSRRGKDEGLSDIKLFIYEV